jgi:hypothetical protein
VADTAPAAGGPAVLADAARDFAGARIRALFRLPISSNSREFAVFLPVPLGFGTFGAFIRLRSAIRSRAELFDVGVAGPLAGMVLTLPALGIGLALSRVAPGHIGAERCRLRHAAADARRGVVPVSRGRPGGHQPASGGARGVDRAAGDLVQSAAGGAVRRRPHRCTRGSARSTAGWRWRPSSALFALWAVTLFHGWLLVALVMTWLGRKHFAVVDDAPLGAGRRLTLALAALIFVLTFHPRASPVQYGAGDSALK